MKVQESLFIQRKKPLLKKLLDMLLEQYPYASILTEDAKSGNYSVSRKNMSVGEGERGTSRGFVVKVSDGKHYAEYSFNQISRCWEMMRYWLILPRSKRQGWRSAIRSWIAR